LADPSDFWFWLLWLGVAVAGGGWFAFRWLHIARMVEDTPTSRIRSAAQGYVELAGRCRALDGTENIAPLTQRPCVWWRYHVQRRTGSGSSSNRRTKWQKVSSGRSEQPFLLSDGTGDCIVQPAGADDDRVIAEVSRDLHDHGSGVADRLVDLDHKPGLGRATLGLVQHGSVLGQLAPGIVRGHARLRRRNRDQADTGACRPSELDPEGQRGL